MKSCTCVPPDSPVEAPRPSLHTCDEPNKGFLAPGRSFRKPSKLQTTVEVTRCRMGNTSRQAAPIGYEGFIPQKDWTPIFHAVYYNREAALHHFLQTGVSPNLTEGAGVPLLCIAAACGHFEIAKILLEAGALVNAALKGEGETALHVAIKGNRHDIIDLLLVHRVDLEARTIHTGETALHYAAADSGLLALVLKLLKFGAKYDGRNLEGQTPAAVALQAHNLHAAVAIINMARSKPKKLAKEKDMLLQHLEKTKDRSLMTNDLIADVFAATCDPDSTVLVEAIKKNDARLVEMFLEKGADPHRATANGLLPIFVAVKFADLRIIKMLAQHSADVTTRGPGNLDVLQVLFKTYSTRDEDSLIAIIDYLLAKGADGLAQYPDGKTLLHRAVSADVDSVKVVKLLIKNGVEVSVQDNDGNTALHLAASHGLINSTTVLLDAHADTTIVDSKKCTPLFRAVQHQQWPVVPLLAVPPAMTSWDAEGSTALHRIARSIPEDHATWQDVAAAARPFCERSVCRSMRDRSGATPLIQAVKILPEEGLPVVETLLTEGGKNRNCVGHEDHKRRDALYYAATLGKPIFVEALLEHGAPFVLEGWTDGERQLKLLTASKDRILNLIIESDRSRKAAESQGRHDLVQETRIKIIKAERRTSSALSGYHADCEWEQKPKPNRHNVREISSTQHLQIPVRQQKPEAPSPTFPIRTPSRQHRSRETTAQFPQSVLQPYITVSTLPVSGRASQNMLRSSRTERFKPHNEQSRRATGRMSSSQRPRETASAFPLRASSRQQKTALLTAVTSLPESKVLVTETPMFKKESVVVTTPPSKDSPAMRKLDAPVEATRVSPQVLSAPIQPTPTPTPAPVIVHSKPVTPPKPSAMISTISTKKASLAPATPVSPATSPKPSSAALALSATTKPVQPARVDSGVSLTPNDSTTEALPTLDRSKPTLDGSIQKTKR